MEESIKDLMSAIHEEFSLDPVDIRSYSPLVLAYIGDGVYELVIRSILVGRGNTQANKLHKKASTLVNAAAQSAMLERIRPELTEEELQVFKRGRNANSATMARHATMSDYRRATGFEALMGYLYLKGDMKRILELVKLGLEDLQ
jgi:ribonuclease-3 family protein